MFSKQHTSRISNRPFPIIVGHPCIPADLRNEQTIALHAGQNFAFSALPIAATGGIRGKVGGAEGGEEVFTGGDGEGCAVGEYMDRVHRAVEPCFNI